MEIKSANPQNIEDKIKDIFAFIGEDINRDGLIDTPRRIVNMWKEIFKGYNPELKPRVTTFNNGSDGVFYDQMIIDSGTFYSICEHHFMPFFGNYSFGYIPAKNGLILGLSKVARVVDYFASKMQIQERLTGEIVNYIWESLIVDSIEPKGMILVMDSEHLCKSMRGIKKAGKMKTSYLKGLFEKDTVRNEFLQLIK